MTVDLTDGYFIDEKSVNNVILKKKYTGIRNGKKVGCVKIVSYHQSFYDAVESFSKLLQSQNMGDSYKSIQAYLEDLKKANKRVADSVYTGHMYKFFMDVPKGNGKAHDQVDIAEYIPLGRENAISRKSLLQVCENHGLVDKDLPPDTKDRKMRRLIEQARMDYVILNRSDGVGYYRVTKDDALDLQAYIRQEENRARSVFRNLTMAKKLYEDYKAGRL